MTGDAVAISLSQQRRPCRAVGHGRWAARMKRAARWGIDWAGHLAFEQFVAALCFDVGAGNGYGREEGLRVRVHRPFVEIGTACDLDDLAKAKRAKRGLWRKGDATL